MKITINVLQKMKQQGQKIAMLTVYDASFAKLLAQCGVDVLLIGDSLGNVIQGENTTIPVNMDHIVYHTQCVGRAHTNKFIISDMPFMSYATLEQSLHNAASLMRAGAHMLKLEGGAWLAETVNKLTERGIPVCAHLGLTPQSIHKLGGYKIQGKENHAAAAMLEDAIQLAEAGAQLLVLECVPTELAEEISSNVAIPTIGIGAGPYCDGQVLVLYDMLGINSDYVPSFVRNFMEGQNSIAAAIKAYVAAVKTGEFPAT